MGSCEVDMRNEDEESYLQLPLVMTAILPLTLKAAFDLGVFEVLVKGCVPHSAGTQPVMMTAHEIAVQLPTNNPQAAVMLDRMLGLLGSFNIVSCTTEEKENVMVRRYGPAPIFKWLAKNEDGTTNGNLIHLGMEPVLFSAGEQIKDVDWNHMDPVIPLDNSRFESMHHLKEAVLEGGIAFEKAYGMTIFEYMGIDPKFSRLYNESMEHHSTLTLTKMLEIYQGFKDVEILIDVGGGVGATLGMIVAKYPHIKGINLDLPHAISKAPLVQGVEHVAGDMFVSIPHADAILVKCVLHNWSDEHCVKILKNCYMALPNKGKVIVVDYLLPDTPQATARSQGAFILDVMMLMQYKGKERTKKEFEALAKEAGFTKVEAQYFCGEMWIIMELQK